MRQSMLIIGTLLISMTCSPAFGGCVEKLSFKIGHAFRSGAEATRKELDSAISEIPDSPVHARLGSEGRATMHNAYLAAINKPENILALLSRPTSYGNNEARARVGELNWIVHTLSEDPQTSNWSKNEAQFIAVLIQEFMIPPAKALSFHGLGKDLKGKFGNQLKKIIALYSRYAVLHDYSAVAGALADSSLNLSDNKDWSDHPVQMGEVFGETQYFFTRAETEVYLAAKPSWKSVNPKNFLFKMDYEVRMHRFMPVLNELP